MKKVIKCPKCNRIVGEVEVELGQFYNFGCAMCGTKGKIVWSSYRTKDYHYGDYFLKESEGRYE